MCKYYGRDLNTKKVSIIINRIILFKNFINQGEILWEIFCIMYQIRIIYPYIIFQC